MLVTLIIFIVLFVLSCFTNIYFLYRWGQALHTIVFLQKNVRFLTFFIKTRLRNADLPDAPQNDEDLDAFFKTRKIDWN